MKRLWSVADELSGILSPKDKPEIQVTITITVNGNKMLIHNSGRTEKPHEMN